MATSSNDDPAQTLDYKELGIVNMLGNLKTKTDMEERLREQRNTSHLAAQKVQEASL